MLMPSNSMRAFTGRVRLSHTPWFFACSPHRRPFSMCQMLVPVVIQSGPGSTPEAAGETGAALGTVLELLGTAGGAAGGADFRSKSSSNAVFITSRAGATVAAAVTV